MIISMIIKTTIIFSIIKAISNHMEEKEAFFIFFKNLSPILK